MLLFFRWSPYILLSGIVSDELSFTEKNDGFVHISWSSLASFIVNRLDETLSDSDSCHCNHRNIIDRSSTADADNSLGFIDSDVLSKDSDINKLLRICTIAGNRYVLAVRLLLILLYYNGSMEDH